MSERDDMQDAWAVFLSRTLPDTNTRRDDQYEEDDDE